MVVRTALNLFMSCVRWWMKWNGFTEPALRSFDISDHKSFQIHSQIPVIGSRCRCSPYTIPSAISPQTATQVKACSRETHSPSRASKTYEHNAFQIIHIHTSYQQWSRTHYSTPLWLLYVVREMMNENQCETGFSWARPSRLWHFRPQKLSAFRYPS